MSSALDKAGKAAASTFPNVVPLLIYAGIGYLIYKLVRDTLKNPFADKEPGVQSQEMAPKTEDSPDDRISGRIIAPAIGGSVASEGALTYTYPITIEVTNPFEGDRAAVISVTTKEFPHLMPETGSTWSERRVFSPGRNVIQLQMRRAAVVNIGITIPAFAQLVIDGRPSVQAVNYEIE